MKDTHVQDAASTDEVFAVFKPRTSIYGWVSSVFLVTALGILFWFTVRRYLHADHSSLVGPGLVIVFFIPSLFFLSIFPTIKYSVGHQSLVLSCGPFKWTILLSGIRSITEKDLDYLPLSEGWKLPGYTLFKIRYGGIGPVRMCATSITKRILVIETDIDVWGITPSDADSFVATIRRNQEC